MVGCCVLGVVFVSLVFSFGNLALGYGGFRVFVIFRLDVGLDIVLGDWLCWAL